ncbi:MAG: hypothetical protein RMJ82_14355 [Gemmatales bacterium]|nr:hypothetical protein [Gemmatales bacterium]
MSVGQGGGRNPGLEAANATQANAGWRPNSAEMSLASALGDTQEQEIAPRPVNCDGAAPVSVPDASGVGSAVGPTPAAKRTAADAPRADVSQDSHAEVGVTRSAAPVALPRQEMPQGASSQEKGEDDQAATASAKPKRQWRWWLFATLCIIALVLSFTVGPLVIIWLQGKTDLARALAETDALDPGWRWEDLVAQVPQVPPDQNGWPVLERFHRDYFTDYHRWHGDVRFDTTRLVGARANERLPQQWVQRLELLPALIPDALPRLEKATRSRAIHPPLHGPFRSWNEYEANHAFPAPESVYRMVCEVLGYHALLFAEKGQIEELERCLLVHAHLAEQMAPYQLLPSFPHGLFHSLEPVNLLFTVRCSLNRVVLSERTLARVQSVLESFDFDSLSLQLIRSERARFHQLLTLLETDAEAWRQWLKRRDRHHIDLEMLFARLFFEGDWRSFLDGCGSRLEEQLSQYRIAIYGWHAECLRLQNEWYQLQQLSPRERLAKLGPTPVVDERLLKLARRWGVSGLPCPDGDYLLRISLSWQARLASDVAALAAERYRLRHGVWPRDWSDLVPPFLREAPRDPYDWPNPLKLSHHADGITIYSIGKDLKDDGGHHDRDNSVKLYNPSQRNISRP